jgi:hypothetical protein
MTEKKWAGTREELTAALDRHGIPYPSLRPLEGSKDGVLLVTVAGEEAIPLWRRLHAVVGETGWWPVVLGDDEELDYHLENLEEWEDEDEESQLVTILRGAEGFDPERWLEQSARELESDTGDWLKSVMGEWAAAPPPAPDLGTSFTIPRNLLTHELFPEVHLGLAPTPRGWEVPAYLRFGGFNSCPQPQEHVALWRRWHALYGAELVGISHDVVEALVARPPADRGAAMRLAREQYIYCDDIVSQGCGTVSALGALLVDRPTWYFWWD